MRILNVNLNSGARLEKYDIILIYIVQPLLNDVTVMILKKWKYTD